MLGIIEKLAEQYKKAVLTSRSLIAEYRSSGIKEDSLASNAPTQLGQASWDAILFEQLPEDLQAGDGQQSDEIAGLTSFNWRGTKGTGKKARAALSNKGQAAQFLMHNAVANVSKVRLLAAHMLAELLDENELHAVCVARWGETMGQIKMRQIQSLHDEVAHGWTLHDVDASVESSIEIEESDAFALFD